MMSSPAGGGSYWISISNSDRGGTTNNSFVVDAVADDDENIYCTYSDQPLNRQGLVVFDSDGNITTSKYINPTDSGTNIGRAIALDGSGNIIIYGSDSNNLWLEKFNSSLVSQWSYEYSDGYAYHLPGEYKGVHTDSSGNIYIAGGGFNNSSWNSIVLMKLNSSGTEQWHTFLGTNSQSDYAKGGALSSNGTKIGFCGRNYQGGVGTVGFGVLNTSDGSTDWTHSYYYSTTAQTGYNAAFDSSNNLIVLAHQRVGSTRKLWIAKFNTSGTKVWDKAIQDGSYSTYGYGLVVDSDNNIYAGIQSNSGRGGIIKLNSSGTKVWDRGIYGSSGSNYTNFTPYNLTITPSGDLLTAARFYNPTGGYNSAFLMRCSTDGPDTGVYGDVDINAQNYSVTGGQLLDQGSISTLGDTTYTRSSRATSLVNLSIDNTTTSL